MLLLLNNHPLHYMLENTGDGIQISLTQFVLLGM